jgi:glycerol uptake facilitator protein
MFLAEIIGTTFITLFGCGAVASTVLSRSKNNGGGFLTITIGWSIGVTLGIYAAGSFSGAHLNPAVTIGLACANRFPWDTVPYYILAQMIGAMLGSMIVFLAYYPHWEATKDTSLKLSVFSTGPAIRSVVSNFVCEFIATFILLFSLMYIGINNYAEGLGPIIVGGLILGIGISFGGPTGYALNPARDLGPRIMHAILPIKGKGASDWSYAWIPVVAPICGGICGSLASIYIYSR